MQITVTDKYRITIPKQIRHKLGIKPGQKVLVTTSGARITIEPVRISESDERLT